MLSSASLLALSAFFLSYVQVDAYYRYIDNTKIVGGHNAAYSQFPYQLLMVTSRSTCGAVIIGQEWALTAAHCVARSHFGTTDVEKARTVFLYSGVLLLSNRLNRHSVDFVWVHQQYDSNTADYDVAVLKVLQPFDLSLPDVGSVPLIGKNQHPTSGQMAVVSGWGHTAEGGSPSNQLKWVEVSVMPHQECQTNYSTYNMDVTPRMFCAGMYNTAADSCQGDSGGPITINGVLVGVVSWGKGCARPGVPGVYTDLAYADIRDMITYVAGIR